MIRTLGVSDVRMEQGSLRCDVNISLNRPGERVGHPHRDQERQLAASASSGRCAPRSLRQAAVLDDGGRIIQETRHFHEDTGDTTLGPQSRRRPPTTATSPSPTWCRSRPDAAWVEELRAALPELPGRAGARLQAASGASPTWTCSRCSTPARVELIEATVAAGAAPAEARKWWLGELARRANEAGVELAELGVTPAQVAELPGWSTPGKLNDKLARAGAGGRARRRGRARRGRGRPRAWRSSPTSGALTAAVDEAIAAQPGRRRQGPRRQGRGASARWSARS